MAAIAHASASQTTRQTHTGDSVYTTITNASISSSSFVAGQKYLIIVSAEVDGAPTNAANVGLLVAHGGTGFADSESVIEVNTVGDGTNGRYSYMWFHVWTAVASEAIELQFKVVTSTDTVGVDQVHLFAMRLDDDLAENTDWFFNENATDIALTDTYQDGASITFTPGTASHDWLVLASAQHKNGTTITISNKTKLDWNNDASALMEFIREGEDLTNDIHVWTHARCCTLDASSQIFKQQSALTAAGGAADTRLHSKVFALNLNKFKDHAFAWTEAQVDLSATDFATQTQTITITPTVVSDVMVIGVVAYDLQSTTPTYKARMQLDDTTDIPGSADAANHGIMWDIIDEEYIAHTGLVTSLSASSHTVDLDGSLSAAAGGRSAEDRSLVAWTMELAEAGAVASGKNWTLLLRSRK